ncbi:hypothetical protein NADE_008012 [Nannochloris sp. 'desiccata']|nr:hypothetical protein KSW81_006152 [Chlorella desiccata (nom. nud.)]KAH7619724.1 hypothetical protein NADE_008012 [Chlorella desiccata (nom. nud.)]
MAANHDHVTASHVGMDRTVDYVFGRKWATVEGKSRPKWLYHIAWLGYSLDQATWEPRRQLRGIRDLVDEYDAAHPRKRGQPKLPPCPVEDTTTYTKKKRTKETVTKKKK